MTLIEFLHPLRRESRTIQVQAALYYIKHYLGRDSAQVAEVRDALIDARMPGAKGTNLGQALARGTPTFARSRAECGRSRAPVRGTSARCWVSVHLRHRTRGMMWLR